MSEQARVVRIKVCGITSVGDALAAAEEGADYLGFNFIAASPRCVTPEDAARIVRALAPRFARVIPIAVVANESDPDLAALRSATGISRLQLHGDETVENVARLGPNAVKAVRIAGEEDARRARGYAGDWVLVDSHVKGMLGGSGATFDWSLVRELARERNVMLAGGLTPDNVSDAIREVLPFAVDVASGVERSPGRKDRALVRAFIEGVRRAACVPHASRPLT